MLDYDEHKVSQFICRAIRNELRPMGSEPTEEQVEAALKNVERVAETAGCRIARHEYRDGKLILDLVRIPREIEITLSVTREDDGV